MAINTAKLRCNDGTFHGKKLDALVDALRSLELTQGRGYKVRKTLLGTTLDIEPGKGGGDSVHPFKVVSAGLNDDETQALVQVTPGLICGNVEPTTIGGYNDQDLIFEIGPTLTRWVYLKVHLDQFGIADAAEIRCEVSVPVNEPGDPDTGAPPPYTYRAVAKVENAIDNVITITNYLTGSQWVSLIVSQWGCQNIVRNAVWTE